MANRDVHIGQEGTDVACGVSYLVAMRKTMALDDVTCLDCLWAMTAASLRNVNLCCARVKTLTAQPVGIQ